MTEFEPGSETRIESEIEHGHADYTDTELLEQCQVNAQAFILALFSAVDEDQALLNHLVARVASTFAAGWQLDREWLPVEVLDALLVNYRSFGAAVESYDPDGDAPSAVLTGLPSAELASQLQVSTTTFRPMLAIGERLAAEMRCALEWSHDAPAGRIHLQVRRAS